MSDITALACETASNDAVDKIINFWLRRGRGSPNFVFESDCPVECCHETLIQKIESLGFDPLVGSMKQNRSEVIAYLNDLNRYGDEWRRINKESSDVRGISWIIPKSDLARDYYAQSEEAQWNELIARLKGTCAVGNFELMNPYKFIPSPTIEKLRVRCFEVIVGGGRFHHFGKASDNLGWTYSIRWGPQTRPTKKLKLTTDTVVEGDN